MFGTQLCDCGVERLAQNGSLEISYGEALRAYWCICWPQQLAGASFPILIGTIPQGATAWQGLGPAGRMAIPIVLSVIALFVVSRRIVTHRFRGFSFEALAEQGNAVLSQRPHGPTANQFRFLDSLQLGWFILWRQVVGDLAFTVLAAPLNLMLSLMGIHVSIWIAITVGLLVIGPIIVKMLVGHQFNTFRIEVKRAVNGNHSES